MALTKNDIKDALKEMGVVTKKDLENLVTKRDLSKVKKELITAVSNVAVNSPTMNQFTQLEKRVDKLEAAVN